MDITELKRNRTNNRHPWERTRAKVLKFLINKYNPYCSHILDIGSGDAFILDYLCKNSIANEYTAIDTAYSEEIINTAVTNTNCKINFFQNLPDILNQKADCVLLLDVLEHCENDNLLLEQAHSNKLTSSPVIFITVPAFQTLFSAHDKLLLHYRRYSIRHLEKTCQKNSYQIIASGYFFTTLLLIRAIQLVLEKFNLYKPVKSIDNWNGGKAISRFISFLLWFDFMAGRFFLKMGIKIPGLSAYCVCRPLPS
jgi:hypothetical protein